MIFNLGKTSWLPIVMGVASFIIGISMGGIFFGAIIHEVSHATICLIYGLPFSLSWSHVTYKESVNDLVNLQVRLAGGLGQFTFSMLFFWFTRLIEKKNSQ